MRGPSWILFAVALAGLACSDESKDSKSGGTCSTRKGSTYLARYVERGGGTCGPLGDETIKMDDAAARQLAAICPAAPAPDYTSCHAETHTNCPTSGVVGQTLETLSIVNWAADATTGSGTVQAVLRQDGSPTCSSVYDVSYNRL